MFDFENSLLHPSGFLFYFHLHGRPPLDAHIHTVLLVPVFAGSVSTMLEVFIKDNIILELFSAGMFILQGTWFYEVKKKHRHHPHTSTYGPHIWTRAVVLNLFCSKDHVVST